MQVALEQFATVAAAMNDDAFPAARSVVVAEVVEHVVHSVAAQDDGILYAALHDEFAIDMQRRLVVEHQRRALGECECCIGVHYERVIDDVGLVGQERSVLFDNQASLLDVGINGTACKDDGLQSSILQAEVQLVCEVERLVAASFWRCHLDAHHQAVVTQHLEVIPNPPCQETSIHIHTEMTVGTTLQLYGTDAHPVAIVVVNVECLGAAGYGADQRVEGDGICREGKPEPWVVRETFIVGAGRNQYKK